MADKKIEKALYGPSTWEVALGALLGLIIGVVAACVYLALKPVQRVPALPKELAPHVVYFIPGNDSSTKSRAWQGKVKTFTNGGEVSFTEEELNAWAATVGAPPPPPAPAKGAPAPKVDPAKDKPAVPTAFLSGNSINFRLRDGKVQVSLKCLVNYYGIGTDLWVVATGRVAKSGEEVEFTPETFYFGSCPLHKLPNVGGFMASRLVTALKLPDEIRAAWGKVTSISVDGAVLKVATKP